MTTNTSARRTPTRTWNLAAVYAVGAALAVGCGTNEPTSEKPPTTAPVTSSPTTATPAPDPTEQAKNAVVDVYRSYWTEMEKAYAQGSVKETDLSKYAAGVALVTAEQNVANHSKAGRTTTGAVVVADSTVTKIDLSRKVPSATLSSCLDISKWDLIDRKTKTKVALPEGRRTRYVIVTTVEQWPEGWRVIKDEPQDQTC